MENQIKNVIEFIKKQEVKGCITGSCLLEYFEGQDVDVFLYNEKAFTKLLYTLLNNDMFTIPDELEQWKVQHFIETPGDPFSKFGLLTIKFLYNTCVPVNIILKKSCTNIFTVLSKFDLNIVAKGYDIETKLELDLSGYTGDKVAVLNPWNVDIKNTTEWGASRILRQISRCFKYYKRGYNTDSAVISYIELIDKVLKLHSIFPSDSAKEKLKTIQDNLIIVKKIANLWLKTHEITEDQEDLLLKTLTNI